MSRGNAVAWHSRGGRPRVVPYALLVLAVSMALCVGGVSAASKVYEGEISLHAGNAVDVAAVDGPLTSGSRVLAPTACAPSPSVGDAFFFADSCSLRFANATAITTVAGSESQGCGVGAVASRDGGDASAATFVNLTGVALLPGSSGVRLLLIDGGAHRLSVFDVIANTVSAIAGTGIAGTSDGQGTSTAQFNGPAAAAVAPDTGAVFVAEFSGHVFRRAEGIIAGLASVTVSTVAGEPGTPGTVDGTGPDARFHSPRAVVYRGADRALYSVGDGEHKLRRTATPSTFTVSSVAGDGTEAYTDGFGASSRLALIRALQLDPSESYLYLAAYDGHKILRFAFESAYLSSVIGTGEAAWGPADDPLAARIRAPAMLCFPASIAEASSTRLYVGGPAYIARVNVVTETRTNKVLAGGTRSGSNDGEASAARLSLPLACAVDSANGTVYIMDTGNRAIRKLSNPHGAPHPTLTKILGNGGGYADGGFGEVRFQDAAALLFHGNALLWTSVSGHTLRRADFESFSATTLAGRNDDTGTSNGDGISTARLNTPRGIDLDRRTADRLFIADSGNHAIRAYSFASLDVSTHSGLVGTSGDAVGSAQGATRFRSPYQARLRIVDGAVYVLDTLNHRIKSVDAETTVAVAGTGTAGDEDGVGEHAAFGELTSAEFDGAAAHLYAVDWNKYKIRRLVIATSALETVAGTGSSALLFDPANPFRSSIPARGLCIGFGGSHVGPETVYIVGNHFVGSIAFGTSSATPSVTVPPTPTATFTASTTATATLTPLPTPTQTFSGSKSLSASSSESTSESSSSTETASRTESASMSISLSTTHSGGSRSGTPSMSHSASYSASDATPSESPSTTATGSTSASVSRTTSVTVSATFTRSSTESGSQNTASPSTSNSDSATASTSATTSTSASSTTSQSASRSETETASASSTRQTLSRSLSPSASQTATATAASSSGSTTTTASTSLTVTRSGSAATVSASRSASTSLTASQQSATRTASTSGSPSSSWSLSGSVTGSGSASHSTSVATATASGNETESASISFIPPPTGTVTNTPSPTATASAPTPTSSLTKATLSSSLEPTDSNSLALSESGTDSDSTTVSMSNSVSDSESATLTSSESASMSATESTSASVSASMSESASTSASHSATESTSETASATTSPSATLSESMSVSTSTSVSESTSASSSESTSGSESISESLSREDPPSYADARGYFPQLYFLRGEAAARWWSGKRIAVGRNPAGPFRGGRRFSWPVDTFNGALHVHVGETGAARTGPTSMNGWDFRFAVLGQCNASLSRPHPQSPGTCGTYRACDKYFARTLPEPELELGFSAKGFTTQSLCSGQREIDAHFAAETIFVPRPMYRWAALRAPSTNGSVWEMPVGSPAAVAVTVDGSAPYQLHVGPASAPKVERFVLDPHLDADQPTHNGGRLLSRATELRGASGSCRLGSVQPYTTFAGVGAGLPVACSVIEESGTRGCATISEALAACDKLRSCTGFTAALKGSLASIATVREEPLFLHTSSYAFQPATAALLQNLGSDVLGAMFHRRAMPSERTCRFVLGGIEAASVQVLVSQAAMADGVVAVYATNGTGSTDRQLVGDCGASVPMASRPEADGGGRPMYGRSGQCDSYALCTEIAPLLVGSVIEVVAPASLDQRGCSTPLNVVLNTSTAGPTTDRAVFLRRGDLGGAGAPPLQDLGGLPATEVAVALSLDRVIRHHVFAIDTWNISVKVHQTAYGCDERPASTAACALPAVVVRDGTVPVSDDEALNVTTTDESSLMRCGGVTAFAQRPGYDALCSTAWDCAALPVPRSKSGVDGVVSFAVNADLLRGADQPAAASDECRGFLGVLAAHGPRTARVQLVGHFPFAGPPRDYAALLSMPLGTSELPLTFLNNASAGAVRTAMITDVVAGIGGREQSLWFVNQTQIPGGHGRITASNVSFTCIFDAATTARECVVVVPAGAEAVAVRVEQTDFVDRAVSVRVEDAEGNALNAKTCGGSSANPFGLTSGFSGACGAFLTCLERFMPIAAARVVISTGAGVRPNGCAFALHAQVDFTTPTIAFNATACAGKFVCEADRSCHPREAVCDGSRPDCPDGADEFPCAEFRHAEDDVAWSGVADTADDAVLVSMLRRRQVGASDVRVVANATSLYECRRDAVFNGSRGFIYSWSNESATVAEAVAPRCVLLSTQLVERIFVAPSAMITAADPATAHPGRRSATYFRVSAPEDYIRCTAAMHCSGRGILRGDSATRKDGDACLCECESGWTGDACDVRQTVGTPAGYYALMSAPPTPLVRAVFAKALEAGDYGVTVTVRNVVPYNATTEALEFTFESSSVAARDEFEQRLYASSAKIAAVNGALSLTSFPQRVLAFFMVDSSNAFNTLAPCTPAGGSISDSNSTALSASAELSSCTVAGSPFLTGRVSVTARGFGIRPVVSVTTVSAAPPSLLVPNASQRRQSDETSEAVPAAVLFNTTLLDCTPAQSATTVEDDAEQCSLETCVVNLPEVAHVAAVDVRFEEATEAGSAAAAPTDPRDQNCSGAERQTTASASNGGSGVPPLSLPEHVATGLAVVYNDGYLAGGASVVSIVAAVAVVLVLAGYVALRRFSKAYRSVLGQLDFLAVLPAWVTRSAVYDHLKTKHRVDMGLAFVAFAVVAALLIAITGLMWLMYARSRETISDAAVVVTFFDSALCRGSDALSTLPFQAVSIPAVGVCDSLSVGGATRSALFGRARCTVADASTASLVIAAAEPDCARYDLFEVERGECLPVERIMPGAAALLPGVFVVTNCVPGPRGSAFAAFMAELVSPAPQKGSFAVPDSTEALTDTTPEQEAPAVIRRTFTTQSLSGVSTATAANVLAAYASHDDVVRARAAEESVPDSWHRHRAVFQGPTALRSDVSALGDGTFASLYRDSFDRLVIERDLRAEDADVERGLLLRFPKGVAGYPAGFIFNGFDTTTESSGSAARREAHRYLGMYESAFDLGYDYNALTSSKLDAFTISMWLKASPRTQGFAFVLADHYEVLGRGRGTGPVLVERLREMVLDGPGTSRAWYNESFSVYASLYVNGASRTLTFAMMAPVLGERSPDVAKGKEQVLVQWSLDEIEQLQLLNGGWHQVSIALQNQKKKPFVALIIDGASSLSSSLWRKCLKRRPEPMRRLDTITVDASPIDVTSSPDGVMYVGYFNGGIQGLTFTPKTSSPAGAIRGGTSEMRHQRSLRRVSLMSIACGLFICACYAAYLCVNSIFAMGKESREEALEDMDAARAVYAESLRTLYTKAFHPLTFDTACRVIGTDDVTFAALVQECAHSPLDDPDDEETPKLMRGLYLAAHPAMLVDPTTRQPRSLAELREQHPTPEEWDAWLRTLPEGDRVPQSVMKEIDDAEAAAQGKPGAKKKKKKKNAKLRVKIKIKVRTGDTSKRKSGGTRGQGGAKAGPKVEAKPDIGAVFLSVVGTMQMAAVYMDTWTVPALYANVVQPIIDIFGLDFLQYAFSDPLAGPILQLCVATLLLCGLAFVLVRDDVNFYRNLLRYQHRRDRVEETPNAISERALNVLLRKIDPDFIIERPFAAEVSVLLMRAEERAAAELFLSDTRVKELELLVQGRRVFLRKTGITNGLEIHASPTPGLKQKRRSTAIRAPRRGPSLPPTDGAAGGSATTSPQALLLAARHEPARNVGTADHGHTADLPAAAAVASVPADSPADVPIAADASGLYSPRGSNEVTPDIACNDSLVIMQEALAPPGGADETSLASAVGASASLSVAGVAGMRSVDASVSMRSANGENDPSLDVDGTLDDDGAVDLLGLADPHVDGHVARRSDSPAKPSSDPWSSPRQCLRAVAPTREKRSSSPDPSLVPICAPPQARLPRAVTGGPADREAEPTSPGSPGSPLAVPPPELRVEGQQLEVVAGRCLVHTDELLVSEMQSNVFPYNTRRTCCVVEDGKRCGAFAGAVFHCPHHDDDGVEDCGYCLCERHFQADLWTLIKISLWAGVRRFTKKGWRWLFFYIVITIAMGTYVPVMRTSVMLLVCHPLYQCVFPGCYKKPTSDYVASVYLAALLVFVYGIGFPVSLFVVLRKRQQTMKDVFSSPYYFGKFMQPVAAMDTHARNAKRLAKAAATRLSEVVRWLLGPKAAGGGSTAFVTSIEAGNGTVADPPRPGSSKTGGRTGNKKRPVRSLADVCDADRDVALGLFDLPTAEAFENRNIGDASEADMPRRDAGGDEADGAAVADDDVQLDERGAKAIAAWAKRVVPPSSQELAAVGSAYEARAASLARAASMRQELEQRTSEAAAAGAREELRLSTEASLEVTSPRVLSPTASQLRRRVSFPDAVVAIANDSADFSSVPPKNDSLRWPMAHERSAVTPQPDDGALDVDDIEIEEDAEAAAASLALASSSALVDEITKAVTFAPADSTANLSMNDSIAVSASAAASDAATIAAERAALKDIALLGSPVLGFPNGVILKLQTGLVALAEYRRFIMTDASSMILLYAQIKFESMHLVPVLSCGKFLLLIPPLVLNPNSLEQIGAIAAGEVLFAVFLQYQAPYHSMWMVIVVLLGNIHQFALVGMKAYITALSHERDASAEVGPAMVAISFAYLAATLCIFAIMLASDTVLEVFREQRLGRVMARLGLTRSKSAPLFVAPVAEPVALKETPMPEVDDSDDERWEFGADADDNGGADPPPEVIRELAAWKAHKASVLAQEQKRRRELRRAEAQEQAVGMS